MVKLHKKNGEHSRAHRHTNGCACGCGCGGGRGGVGSICLHTRGVLSNNTDDNHVEIQKKSAMGIDAQRARDRASGLRRLACPNRIRVHRHHLSISQNMGITNTNPVVCNTAKGQARLWQLKNIGTDEMMAISSACCSETSSTLSFRVGNIVGSTESRSKFESRSFMAHTLGS
jgi:hypothetical protein